MNNLTPKLVFLLLLLWSGCQDITPKPKSIPFFSLKSYFEQETKRLSSLGQAKKITVAPDGKQEEHLLPSLDFEKELSLFSNSDINRPAWSDKYGMDTVLTESGDMMLLKYWAFPNEAVKTRKVEVYSKKGQVYKIFVENQSSNLLSDALQRLTYEPEKGYTIENWQKNILGARKEFKVEVQFLER